MYLKHAVPLVVLHVGAYVRMNTSLTLFIRMVMKNLWSSHVLLLNCQIYDPHKNFVFTQASIQFYLHVAHSFKTCRYTLWETDHADTYRQREAQTEARCLHSYHLWLLRHWIFRLSISVFRRPWCRKATGCGSVVVYRSECIYVHIHCTFSPTASPQHAAKWMCICIITNHYSWTNPCKAAHTTNACLRHETLHVFTIYGFNARMCVMQEYSDRDRDCEYVFERMLMWIYRHR